MSEELRPRPLWFKVAFRALACTFMIGLAAIAIPYFCHVRIPRAIGEPLGFAVVYGAIAFIVLEWFGASRGYVRSLDATIYTFAFIVMGCGGVFVVRF